MLQLSSSLTGFYRYGTVVFFVLFTFFWLAGLVNSITSRHLDFVAFLISLVFIVLLFLYMRWQFGFVNVYADDDFIYLERGRSEAKLSHSNIVEARQGPLGYLSKLDYASITFDQDTVFG